MIVENSSGPVAFARVVQFGDMEEVTDLMVQPGHQGRRREEPGGQDPPGPHHIPEELRAELREWPASDRGEDILVREE